MELLIWLMDAVREPLAELVRTAVLAAIAGVTLRLRAEQRRVKNELQVNGVLPPPPGPSAS